MIKRLQLKIILIITCLMVAVVSIIMVSINVIAEIQTTQRIDAKLEQIAEKNGNITNPKIDPYFSENESFAESFSVLIGNNNELLSIVSNRDVLVLADQIIELVNEAFQKNQDSGTMGNYAYLIKGKPYGTIVVFLDISAEKQQNNNLIITTGVIGVISIIIFLIIAILLSGWLVKPVQYSFERQKVFISDASHELKTPLAVISANVDVLQSEIGDNKWLGYISSETARMSELVNELLSLARLDDKSRNSLTMSDFNLTDLVLQTALPFESSMFEAGKSFTVDAQENITCHGDPSAIRHILTILIDNAAKYSDDNGEVSVRLSQHGTKKIIEVYNTGMGISSDKLDKVFERFYREDQARNSKTGGYGLGLAIAKAITEAHGGNINVQSDYGKWARFTVTL